MIMVLAQEGMSHLLSSATSFAWLCWGISSCYLDVSIVLQRMAFVNIKPETNVDAL